MANWLSGLKHVFQGRRGSRRPIRKQPPVKPRRPPLALERLEDRVTPTSTLTISGGVATFVAAAGKANALTVSVSGSTYTFKDTGDKISVNGGPAANTVTASGITASLSINLGDGNDTANIESIKVATTVTGGSGTNTINVSSDAPTNTGNLSRIAATLTVTASNGGSDTLTVSNFGATTGDTNVVVGSNTITGFAPNTITYNTASGGTFSLIHLLGSNSSTLAENFTINNPGATFQLDAGAGNDTANVRTLSRAATLNMGAGNDAINVSSDAPAHLGNVDGVQAALTIDGGTGSNTLEVSDYGKTTGAVNATLTSTAITGLAPAAISYRAVGGSFSSIQVDGSNTLGDAFTINSTLAGSHTTVLGNGGNDSFALGGPTVAVTIGGGGGSDTLSGVSNATLSSSAGAGFTGTAANTSFSGIDTLSGSGSLTSENLASTWTLHGPSNTSTYNDGSNSLNFLGFGTLNGGSAADTFNLGAGASSGYAINGGAGADTLSGVGSSTISSSGATGFSGSANAGGVTFTGIDTLIGVGSLTGRNVASTWTVNATASNSTYSDGAHSLTFSGFSTLGGGSGADTFNLAIGATGYTLNGGSGSAIDTLTGVSNAGLTSSSATGFSGSAANSTSFTGINTLSGSGTLTGENATSIWTLGATQTYSDGSHALTFSGFDTLQGGSAADTFNVNATNTETLLGGPGNDVFNIANGVTTASVQGQDGSDALNLSAYTTPVTVTVGGSGGSGFYGAATGVTNGFGGGFAGIDVVVGASHAGGSLTGEDNASTWTVNAVASNSTYNDGFHSLTFSGFGTLDGGGATDMFNLASGVAGYAINGGSGSAIDTLTGVTNAVLASSDATGYSGSADSGGVAFTGIDTLDGAGSSTLTGPNSTGNTISWTINAVSANSTVAGLNFSGFSTLNGGTTGGNTFNLQSGVAGYTINGKAAGGYTDELTGASNATLTGSGATGFSGTADNSISFTGIDVLSGSGTLTGENATSTWTLGATQTYSDGTHNLTFSGFGTLQGGTAADTFNVNADNSETLLGGPGDDVFNIVGATIGSVEGQDGSDTLSLIGYGSVTVDLGGSGGTGFYGVSTGLVGGFFGIDVATSVSNARGSLFGEHSAHGTWTVGASPSSTSSYTDGSHTLTFSGFDGLGASGQGDTFNLQTAPLSPAANFTLYGGGNGTNTLNGVSDPTLTGSVTGQGYSGTADNGISFTAINVLSGGGSLTGENAAGAWTLGSPFSTYTDASANALNFSGFAALNGSGTDTLAGVTNATLSGSSASGFSGNADGPVAAPGSPGDPSGLIGIAPGTYGTRSKASFVTEVGRSLADVTAIYVLDLHLFDGPGGTQVLPAPAGSPYAYLLRNMNDGVGDDVTLGVVEGVAFTGMTTLDGSGSLTGENAGGLWTVNANPTYWDGAHTLSFSGFNALSGGNTGNTFNVTVVASPLTLNGNTTAGPDIFNVGSNNSLAGIQSALTINGAANDTLNVSDTANTTSEAWTITGSTDGTTDTTDIQSGSPGLIAYNVAGGSIIHVNVGAPTDGSQNAIDVESLASSNVGLTLTTQGNSDVQFAQVGQSLAALSSANITVAGANSDTLTLNDQADAANTLYGASDSGVAVDSAGLTIHIPSALGQVIVLGGSGSNTVNVTPSHTTSFTVDGGSSGTNTLNYQASQVSGPADNPQDDMGFSISDGDGYYQTVYNYDFASANIDLPAQNGKVTFNLPAGAQAVLEAAPGKPGYDDIRSTGGPGFQTTTFSNPSGSLTVNTAGSGSVVQLAAMDAGFAPTTETFDGQASDTFIVVSTTALTSATSVTDNGTLDLNGNSITVGGLVGNGVVTNGAASGTATLTLGGGGFNVFAGSIQDGASAQTALTVVGGTTFVVTGDNTYTGATLINGGLAVGNGGTTGSLASGTAITDNNVLEFARTDAITVANSITGSSGGVVAFFSGTVTLTTAETYSDPTQIFAGATLKAGVANALPSGTALTVNGTLDLNGYDDTVGDLTGSGIVTNNAAAPSSSTLTVNGADSFSGSVQNGGPNQTVVIV